MGRSGSTTLRPARTWAGTRSKPAKLLALKPLEFTGYRLQNRTSPVNEVLEWHATRAVCVGEPLDLSASVVDCFVRGRCSCARA